MRHFIFHENGGPFPGSCMSCNNNRELFDVGGQPVSGGTNLLCKRCVTELATFIGFVEEEPLIEQINLLESDLEAHEIELAKVPDLVDGLINGIRSSLTDFIFAVSYDGGIHLDEDVSHDDHTDNGSNKGGAAPKRNNSAPVKPAGK